MLTITIPACEYYDSLNNRFHYSKEQEIVIEHSLVSISKWEQKFKVPFLGRQLSGSEFIEYVKCMTITKNVDPLVYNAMTKQNIEDIKAYMEDPMTATWFSKMRSRTHSGKAITNELVYYWMFALNIPIDCQKWHFNRLTTLIRVCSEENAPKEKMSQAETAAYYAKLNAERKKKWGTTG